MVNKARRKDIFEVFESVQKTKSRQDKINILKENNCSALRDVCRGFYDDVIQWNLPPGTPPYTPNIPQSVSSTLLKQHLQFKYFVKGSIGDQLPAFKRERIFVNVLESIHPKDAEILIDMINKKPIKGITKKLVEETFPKLIVK